jgi:hypothetical protein
MGILITGLPGSGKTREAMSIVHSVMEPSTETAIAVISPTEEWNRFGSSRGMYVVRLYDGTVPINFFSCPKMSCRSKFYEDLAMLLSSAADAGPYRNPMEKCMLNAFRKVYQKEEEPNPSSVYREIEESIIKFHARRTNVGVKYTKHGENIKSALENLRGILARPEYCSKRGVGIEGLVRKGVVFDLSLVSGKIKPYIYALLLNQLYSLADQFDVEGDGMLRMLLCVEEAQIILGGKESPAVQDMRQKIQDFRKKGVGLMLLAHNLTDIEQGIRRLCQTKLYLKQAPDVARAALQDLILTYVEESDLETKLKHLDSRTGALNYVTKIGDKKISNDTVFVRTIDYAEGEVIGESQIGDYMKEEGIEAPKESDYTISLKLNDDRVMDRFKSGETSISLRTLGEEVREIPVSNSGANPITLSLKLVRGLNYEIALLDSRKREIIVREFIPEMDAKINL